MAAGVLLVTASAASAADGPASPLASDATFGREAASISARKIAAWILATDDHHGRSFIVVDKPDAKVFLFDGNGRLQGAAPALLGLARGDTSPPGIGTRPLSQIASHERTTPAGRFDATLGQDLKGKDILWVDYDAAISLHRVIIGNPLDRRLARLATPTARDNRISYGCINVPAAFYDQVVRPAFDGLGGAVYVLPDTDTLTAVFPAYGRAAHASGTAPLAGAERP